MNRDNGKIVDKDVLFYNLLSIKFLSNDLCKSIRDKMDEFVISWICFGENLDKSVLGIVVSLGWHFISNAVILTLFFYCYN